MMEFTATATRRPDVFRQTLDSFAGKLEGVGFGVSTLYLNVDPIPDGESDEVAAVAREFFGYVVVNAPQSACFPAAVKWCWSQPQGEYFFGLEDDWRLVRPVNVGDMLALLQADPPLSLVNLRAYRNDDDRLCLAPGLWRTSHARVIAERLTLDANPERQLRRQGPNNPEGGRHEGFKGMQYPPGEIAISDIGRAWMKQNGLKRDGDRKFIKWASTKRNPQATSDSGTLVLPCTAEPGSASPRAAKQRHGSLGTAIGH